MNPEDRFSRDEAHIIIIACVHLHANSRVEKLKDLVIFATFLKIMIVGGLGG